MRLWSLHPLHLDRAGLVAGWREALLAQAVLAGRTKGYQHHPQLIRFRAASDPLAAIGSYLTELHREAERRGYRFDESKVLAADRESGQLTVTEGQLAYEWAHLGEKLARRSPGDAERWHRSTPTTHPLFTLIPGVIESWERT
ncbi:pyrimidine dimer DNA glycosylase/endonuclease V [Leucobacter denitrificans]|uniref:Pyrimidine dimer DNA glycosylase n=1 Tax=Leucobacter denitrificans TaxID=683042 RepID=A0A7G9S3V9_9MICO|nr:pyrimidine dimer DNA glycosylase/endonuclease V [Leucobacter denitrificans]QNN62534.1 hypothetical protein H9L06_09830 [Leucobacter denitrificans]